MLRPYTRFQGLLRGDGEKERGRYPQGVFEGHACDLRGRHEAEGSKSLVQYLSTDQVTTALCDIRNESITGDTAVAEVKTAGMPNGAKIVFVKEGNDWKLTNRSPSLDAVKQTANNSNSGK
jgi:hypothetical protein